MPDHPVFDRQGLQGRLMLVASLNVFAKVVATRYLLSGTPANEALGKAWDDIGDSFTLHAKRRGKEQ